MGSRIPKPKKTTTQEGIIKPHFIPSDENVTFSFSALERTKHFNLDMTCQNWASELFDMLKNISTHSMMLIHIAFH